MSKGEMGRVLNDPSKAPTNIDYVVESDLCTRCGACYGVCPHDAIVWDNNSFPHTTNNCTGCKLCLKVCGGIEVDFPKFVKRHYGKNHVLTENAIGPLLYSKAAYSTNRETRKKGASGGVASQILISLLEKGEIDGAVVTGYSCNNPLKPEARIARNREEILCCSQSKYTLFPVAHIYSEIIRIPGRYAIVGLPCQIHSLFRWQDINSKLKDRVVLVIGLFCHANLGNDVLTDLLKVKKILPEQVSKMEFRGGEWPGGIRVTFNNGTILPLHSGNIKDGAFNYLNKLYIAKRCMTCIDFSAELSDIAISDPWIRDRRGEYMFKGGWSVAHVRTERGHNIFSGMEMRKEIVTRDIDKLVVINNFMAMTRYKKRGAFIRLAKLKRKGKPTPEYYIDSPPLRIIDYFRELLFQASLFGWYFKPLRRPLLAIAFSSFGGKFGKCKGVIKKWKYHIFNKYK